MGALTRNLKPSEGEILALAVRETDPREAHRFEPISRGPVLAVIAIIAILVLAIPSLVARAVRGFLAPGSGPAE